VDEDEEVMDYIFEEGINKTVTYYFYSPNQTFTMKMILNEYLFGYKINL